MYIYIYRLCRDYIDMLAVTQYYSKHILSMTYFPYPNGEYLGYYGQYLQ